MNSWLQLVAINSESAVGKTKKVDSNKPRRRDEFGNEEKVTVPFA